MSKEAGTVTTLLFLTVGSFFLSTFIFFDIAKEFSKIDELVQKLSEHNSDLKELSSVILRSRKQYPLHKNDFVKERPYCSIEKDEIYSLVYLNRSHLLFWSIPKENSKTVVLRKRTPTLVGFYKNIANQWLNVLKNPNNKAEKDYVLLSNIIYDGQIKAFSSPDSDFSLSHCENITY